MLDKRGAAEELVEDRLPLLTPDVRHAVYSIFTGPVRITAEGVLELVKQFPDHFAGLIYKYTQDFGIEGNVVWTNPETNTEYHDVDVEVVRRYIIIGRKLFSHYMSRPREQFIAKCERYAARKRARDAEKAVLEDQDRFFSLPFTAISSERWASLMALPCLTAEQCATLALGRNPDEVTIKKAESAVGDGHSAFLNAYRRQIMFFERFADVKGTQAKNIITGDFLIWSKKEGIPFALTDPEPATQKILLSDIGQNELSLPAIHSLYKIMYGFVLKAFPDANRRISVVPEIATLKGEKSFDRVIEEYLKTEIARIDHKTILKYLRFAHGYLRSSKLLVRPEIQVTNGKSHSS